MILPTKHISTPYSLLGVSSTLLDALHRPQTVTQLWERARILPQVKTYERFVLALDLLYLVGVLELRDGLLKRVRP